MNRFLLIFSIILVASAAFAIDTTHRTLVAKSAPVALTVSPDSVTVPCSPLQFIDGAVTIKGFDKRASDSRETFFLTNHTSLRISRIVLSFRYSDMKGHVIHEREVAVDCDLPSGATRQATVKTFDVHHIFYYYLSGKPRKSATPFQVSARILRYDVMVTRPVQ
jgi:hypothetical protein